MYKVLEFFNDLQDDGYAYKPGDMFPREGLDVSPQRIAELSGIDNRLHKKLIAADALRKRGKKAE
jgi:hypothetical protein